MATARARRDPNSHENGQGPCRANVGRTLSTSLLYPELLPTEWHTGGTDTATVVSSDVAMTE